MRILGLDYGSKTVGVAVSDPLGVTAQRLETIWRKQENKLRRTLAQVEELVKEYEIEKIVLGYPKNMNNTVGERAEKALEFGEMLKKRTGLEVIMWDERLTTVSADRTLMEAGVRRENRKEYLDGIAAVFILQGYLDSLKMQEVILQSVSSHFITEPAISSVHLYGVSQSSVFFSKDYGSHVPNGFLPYSILEWDGFVYLLSFLSFIPFREPDLDGFLPVVSSIRSVV